MSKATISNLKISAQEITDALNGLVKDFLPPSTFILSLLYIGFAIGHIFFVSPPFNLVMCFIASFTAIILFSLAITLRKYSIALNLAHPICTFIAMLIIINSFFHMYLLGEPKHSTNFMLLIIGLGSIYLSFNWYLFTLSLSLISWTIAVYLSNSSPEWAHFGFAIFTSSIVASIIYRARLTNFKNLITLQLQEKKQQLELKASKDELEEVLKSLTASEAHTKSLINNMLVGLITFSDYGIIYSMNPAAEKIFDYKENQLVGRPIQTLFSKRSTHNTDQFSAFLKKYLGNISQLEAIKKDGSIFDVEFSLSEFIVNNQHYFAGHIRDISEQKEVERLKTEFVGSVSHELRTPLTSISGSLSLLSAGLLGDLTAESYEAIEIAERNSKRLLNLINDILDYERLEKGTLEMNFEHIPLKSVILRATETIQAIAKQQEVFLEVPDVSTIIVADEDRIAQVLVNLLSNAIKFSLAKSKIIISCEETTETVIVKVTDFGRGVPQKLHKQIFDRFKQVEASDSREKGGTGLGLAICKAIIEYHNGEIAIESEEGKGSTFWFSLPNKSSKKN